MSGENEAFEQNACQSVSVERIMRSITFCLTMKLHVLIMNYNMMNILNELNKDNTHDFPRHVIIS